MYIEKLASQIKNDVIGGLRGYHSNLSINQQQLEDEVVASRLEFIHQYFLKGVSPIKDLLLAINCIKVDCKSLERCVCKQTCEQSGDTLVAHFEIPQLITYFDKNGIDYIGSTDRKTKFNVITSLSDLENKKYRKRANNKPYVWIDLAPNSNGMLDCFVFNAPFLEEVSIVAAFKDPRQLNQYYCCSEEQGDNTTFLDHQVKEKLTKEKIYYYRQLQAYKLPNTQSYE